MADEVPQETNTLIVRMERVPYIDQSGLYALEDSILRLSQEGKTVAISGLQKQPADMLRRIELIPNLVPEEFAFETFGDCKDWLSKPKEQTATQPESNS